MVSVLAAGTRRNRIPQLVACGRLVFMAADGQAGSAAHTPGRSVRKGGRVVVVDAERPKQAEPMKKPSANELSHKVQSDRTGDAWFAEQFAAASHTLWCIAFSITSNRTLAEDVVQESATIAFTKLSEFTPGTNFGAWVGKIVRFVALNHARRAQRDGCGPTDPAVLDRVPAGRTRDESSVVTGRGELRLDQGSFDDRLTSALDTLDATPRACLLLRTLLNLPYREIAAALDIPEGTAMSHVHRARIALRELLADDPPMRDSKGREAP
jgi:RNA polymerase sigma-70 factor (ECF subfamily)